MRRSLVRIAALLAGVMLVVIVLFGPGLLAAPITLLIGWWPSAARLIRAWHPNPVAVVLFAVAVIVLVAGAHAFLRWLYARLRQPEGSTLPPNWSWKWTFCGIGTLVCTLVAVCCVVLTAHQLYWISRSPDLLFTDPFRGNLGIRSAAMTLQKAADDAQWDGPKTRDAFWKENSLGGVRFASEAVQPVWIDEDEQRLRAIILVPRRPMQRARARITVIERGTNLVTRRLDELPQVLASFGIGSLAEPAKDRPTLLP